MTQEGFKRKLVAILSADFVGHSLLMADNEVFLSRLARRTDIAYEAALLDEKAIIFKVQYL